MDRSDYLVIPIRRTAAQAGISQRHHSKISACAGMTEIGDDLYLAYVAGRQLSDCGCSISVIDDKQDQIDVCQFIDGP